MDSSVWIIFDQHNVITWLNVASVATIFNIKTCIKMHLIGININL